MDLPPYAALIGATLEAGGDEPILLMPYGEAVLGRPGFLHGGAIAGLMEMAAVAALARALDADGGGRIKPITVTVDYMRGGRDHDTRALGRVTRLGNRVANVEAIAWQDDVGRPIASARMNYLIVR